MEYIDSDDITRVSPHDEISAFIKKKRERDQNSLSLHMYKENIMGAPSEMEDTYKLREESST